MKVDVVKAPVVKRALTIRRKDGSNSESKKLSPLEVRAKVVEEILNTERDYVNHLRDIVEVRGGGGGIWGRMEGGGKDHFSVRMML